MNGLKSKSKGTELGLRGRLLQQRGMNLGKKRKEDTSIDENTKVEKLDTTRLTLDLITPLLIPSANSASRPNGRHRRQEGK